MPKRSPSLTGYRTGLVLGLSLIALGLGQTYFGLVRPLVDVLRARSWRAVEVSDVKAGVFPFHGVDHASFDYSYEFDGHRYTGHRYAFLHPASYMDEEALWALDAHLPPVAYVDSSRPHDSVLVRDLPLRAYRFGGGVLAAGGLIFLGWLSRARALTAARLAGVPRESWLDVATRRVPAWLLRGLAIVVAGYALWRGSSSSYWLQSVYSFAAAGVAACLWTLWPPALTVAAVLLFAVAIVHAVG